MRKNGVAVISQRKLFSSQKSSVTIALRGQQVALVRAQLGGHVHEIVFVQTTPQELRSIAVVVTVGDGIGT